METETYSSTEDEERKYIAYVVEPITKFRVCVEMPTAQVYSSARKAALTSAIIELILLIIGSIFSYFMAISFVKPLLAVDSSISDLSHGVFSRINKYTERKDEFGTIVNNTNSVIEKLSDIVGNIKLSAGDVAESSDELAGMAGQISSTTDHVAEAIQNVASGAIQQAEEIQEAAANTNTITTAVDNVKSSTVDMSKLANRMKEASEISSSSLSTLETTSSDMTTKIDEIATKIASTQHAISKIIERVEGITGIASQTNLLSLNASIEAARAGEAGKGFAVVAEEIRKLADDSDSLASEIRVLMDELLKESDYAVKAASQVKEGNLEQQKALSKTLEAVNGMLSDIEETVASVSQISGEADTCVNSNSIVSNAMSSLSAISEENAASTETTGASVQELSATVTTLAESAASLKDIAQKLNEDIQFFK